MRATNLPAAFYTPPRPVYSAERLGLQFLRAARTNALLIWPDAAYERDVLVHRFLRRTRMLINTPEAIHRVLVENTGNIAARRRPSAFCGRSPATECC